MTRVVIAQWYRTLLGERSQCGGNRRFAGSVGATLTPSHVTRLPNTPLLLRRSMTAEPVRRRDTRVTPLQLQILRLLWSRGEATAEEVRTGIEGETSLALTTVRTLLKRLERRGVVGHRTLGRVWRFRAEISEADVVAASVRGVVQTLFAGRTDLFVQYLLCSHRLTHDDLLKVRDLVDERLTHLQWREPSASAR